MFNKGKMRVRNYPHFFLYYFIYYSWNLKKYLYICIQINIINKYVPTQMCGMRAQSERLWQQRHLRLVSMRKAEL